MKILFQGSLGTPFYQKNIKMVPSEPRKTMKNLSFFMFFQGFTFFVFWAILNGFLLQNGTQGVIFAPQKSHKGIQRAPKMCLRRPSGAAGGVLLLPLSHLEGPQTTSLTLHGGSEAQF